MQRPVDSGGAREPASGSVRLAAFAVAVIAVVSAVLLTRQSTEPKSESNEAAIHLRAVPNPFSQTSLAQTRGLVDKASFRSGERAVTINAPPPKQIHQKKPARTCASRSVSDIGIRALSAADPIVREDAVLELAEAGGESAVRTLAMALDDEDVAVREAAIEALVEIGDEAAVRVLGSLLYATDAQLRSEAVDALGEIESEAATELLKLAAREAFPPLDAIAREYLVERRYRQ